MWAVYPAVPRIVPVELVVIVSMGVRGEMMVFTLVFCVAGEWALISNVRPPFDVCRRGANSQLARMRKSVPTHTATKVVLLST